MGSTSEKVKCAIVRLKNKLVLWDKEEGAEEAELAFSDARELGRILEACELGKVLGRSERFSKPVTVRVMRPGYFRMEDTMWGKGWYPKFLQWGSMRFIKLLGKYIGWL